MLERCKDVSEIGQAILRPHLVHDFETVGPFAAADGSLPFAIAAIERQNRFACGQAQHVTEIIALLARQRDRFAGRQGGLDKQPWLSKIVLRHDQCSNPRPFSPKDESLCDYWRSGAAQRRAVAQFHGLLRTGGNRKIPYRNRSSIGKTPGSIGPPEKQL